MMILDSAKLKRISRTTTLPNGADDHLNPPIQERHVYSEDRDFNDRGRGRTVETQSGGLSVLRAHWNWVLRFG